MCTLSCYYTQCLAEVPLGGKRIGLRDQLDLTTSSTRFPSLSPKKTAFASPCPSSYLYFYILADVWTKQFLSVMEELYLL